jgi:hypothetical protein
MAAHEMELEASDEAFDEEGYLLANPDVAEAVRSGLFATGRQHFDLYGRQEEPRRRLRMSSGIRAAKQAKLERILPLVRTDVAALRQDHCIDCLPASVRERWNIVDTQAVSRHGYGDEVKTIIARHPGGLVLDVGAGCRPISPPVHGGRNCRLVRDCVNHFDLAFVTFAVGFLQSRLDCIVTESIWDSQGD